MKILKTNLLMAVAVGAVVLAPAAAQAARSWVLPSTTVLSGKNAWITVDAASSDELYIPGLRPLPLTSIRVIDADGQTVEPQNGFMGKFRSSVDVQLTKPGTYKIASVTTTIIASWSEAGQVRRFRGSDDEFAKQVPASASELRTVKTVSRNETFVTRDTPTTQALKVSGEGLELEPITHPSDVIVGEAASFRFLLNGKPADGLEVLVMRGGDHWKSRPAEIKAKTGPDGSFKLTLPEGGIWWISATYRTGETGRGPGGPQAPAQPLAGDGYGASYTATVEAQLP